MSNLPCLASNQEVPSMQKKVGNVIYNEERSYSMEVDSEITPPIELVQQDIKTAIEHMLHVSKEREESTGCCGETWKM